jgi:hypothetical protein
VRENDHAREPNAAADSTMHLLAKTFFRGSVCQRMELGAHSRSLANF